MNCGNNAEDPNPIGTRHGCLKKGIGVGYYKVPLNLKYAGSYTPIEKRYCGNKTVLPAGYDRMGTCGECYNMGVGVGMAKKAKEHIAGADGEGADGEGSVNGGSCKSQRRKSSKRKLSRRKLSRRKLSRRKLSRRKLSRRKLSKRKLSKRKLSKRKLSKRKLSKRKLNF